MADKIKRCPFRTGQNGEFAERYREGCMAYNLEPYNDYSLMGGHMRCYKGVCQMLQSQEKK